MEALTSRYLHAQEGDRIARSAAENERNNGQIPKWKSRRRSEALPAKALRRLLHTSVSSRKLRNFAYLYDIAATVDAEVDLDAANVLKVRIKRWAGFGLDEAVSHDRRNELEARDAA
ncbi:MAG: hypothetical protein M9893_07840 [Pyrinomonadaceae bacterium]|nr:hypothetical protein [Pyrinomonadaceae bacterium]